MNATFSPTIQEEEENGVGSKLSLGAWDVDMALPLDPKTAMVIYLKYSLYLYDYKYYPVWI